jgi:hypothetical protein
MKRKEKGGKSPCGRERFYGKVCGEEGYISLF